MSEYQSASSEQPTTSSEQPAASSEQLVTKLAPEGYYFPKGMSIHCNLLRSNPKLNLHRNTASSYASPYKEICYTPAELNRFCTDKLRFNERTWTLSCYFL